MQRLTPRSLLGRTRVRWEVFAAGVQVRRLCRSSPPVRVCWDLDNTVVDTGRLLREGARLEDAVVAAEPVPNMLSFFAALGERLPEAENVIVTARRRSMRRATHDWLRGHGIAAASTSVCLVPYAEAKIALWRRLAAGAQLVIVDDLSYGHEQGHPSSNRELIEIASATADVYVGRDEIAAIAEDAGSVAAVVSAALHALTGRGAVVEASAAARS